MKKSTQEKAIIYARVSSEAQEKEGFSIPSQLQLARDYAREKGFQVVQEYTEVMTGAKTGRKIFKEMANFLKNEQKKKFGVRHLLVEKTDRFSRNFKDITQLDVNEMDIFIHLIKENAILCKDSNCNEQFMFGMQVLIAKRFIDNLKEEISKGLLQKAKQGYFPTVAPFGYINAKENGKKVIKIDDPNASAVKKIFEWYATGQYSLKTLTKKAADAGFRNRRGANPISKSTIECVLKNHIYYGRFRFRNEWYSGKHDPIISYALFKMVQDLKKRNGQRKTGVQVHDWRFGTLVQCGYCGCSMIGEKKKGKYIYYHCTGSIDPHCINKKKYVPEAELEKQFTQAIEDVTIPEAFIGWIIKSLQEGNQEAKLYAEKELTKSNKELNRLEKRTDILYEDRLEGILTPQEYVRQKDLLNERIFEVQERIRQVQGAQVSTLEQGFETLELCQKAPQIYAESGDSDKKRILKMVASNSIWKDGKLSVKYTQLFELFRVARVQIEIDQLQKAGRFAHFHGKYR